MVHLYYRTKGTGADQESKIKTTEDQIFNSLDTLQDTTNNVQVIQSWDRKSETFPLSRVHSTIRVTSEAISSTDGQGILGDEITISLPSPVGALDVINVISDEAGVIKDLDLDIDSEQIYTRIRNTGLLSIEIAVSVDIENNIKSIIFTGEDISITFTKGGVANVRTVNLSTIIASGTRREVEKQILTMDVKY